MKRILFIAICFFVIVQFVPVYAIELVEYNIHTKSHIHNKNKTTEPQSALELNPQEEVVSVARSEATLDEPWKVQCREWADTAGVPLNEAAILLIQHESHCNPNAVNPTSGACGIGQQLPCGKWLHTWNDPVGGLKDMYMYVLNRYGSWDIAWAKWNERLENEGHGWY